MEDVDDRAECDSCGAGLTADDFLWELFCSPCFDCLTYPEES